MAEEKEIAPIGTLEALFEEDVEGFAIKAFPALQDFVSLEIYDEGQYKPGLMFPSGHTCAFASAMQFMEKKQVCPKTRTEITAVHMNVPILRAAGKVKTVYQELIVKRKAEVEALQAKQQDLVQQITLLQPEADQIRSYRALRDQKAQLENQKKEITRAIEKNEKQRITLTAEREKLEARKAEEEKKRSFAELLEKFEKQIPALKENNEVLQKRNNALSANIKKLQAGTLKEVSMLLPQIAEREEKAEEAAPLAAPAPIPQAPAPFVEAAPEILPAPIAAEEKKGIDEEAFAIFVHYHFRSLTDSVTKQPYKKAYTFPSGLSFCAENIQKDSMVEIYCGKKHGIQKRSIKGSVLNHALNQLISEVRDFYIQVCAHGEKMQGLQQQHIELADTLSTLQSELEGQALPTAEEMHALQAKIVDQSEENAALTQAHIKTEQTIEKIETAIAALQPAKKAPQNKKNKRRATKQEEAEKALQEERIRQLKKTYAELEKQMLAYKMLESKLIIKQKKALDALWKQWEESHPITIWILCFLLVLPEEVIPSDWLLQYNAFLGLAYFSPQEIAEAYAVLEEQGILYLQADGRRRAFPPEQKWIRNHLLSTHWSEVIKIKEYFRETCNVQALEGVEEEKHSTHKDRIDALCQMHPDATKILGVFAYLAPGKAVPRAWFEGENAQTSLHIGKNGAEALQVLITHGVLKEEAGLLSMSFVDHLGVRIYLSSVAMDNYRERVLDWLFQIHQGEEASHHVAEWSTLFLSHLLYLVARHDKEGTDETLSLLRLLSIVGRIYVRLQKPEIALTYFLRSFSIEEKLSLRNPLEFKNLLIVVNIYARLRKQKDISEQEEERYREDCYTYALRAWEAIQLSYGKENAALAKVGAGPGELLCDAVCILTQIAEHFPKYADPDNKKVAYLMHALHIAEQRIEINAIEIAYIRKALAMVQFFSQEEAALENAQKAYPIFAGQLGDYAKLAEHTQDLLFFWGPKMLPNPNALHLRKKNAEDPGFFYQLKDEDNFAVTLVVCVMPATLIPYSWLTKQIYDQYISGSPFLQMEKGGIKVDPEAQRYILWRIPFEHYQHRLHIAANWLRDITRIVKGKKMPDRIKESSAFILPLEHMISKYTQYVSQHDSALADLLSALGEAYWISGQPNWRAVDVLLNAIAMREAHHGQDHIAIIHDLENLHFCYKGLGCLRKQHACLERMLHICRRHYGEGEKTETLLQALQETQAQIDQKEKDYLTMMETVEMLQQHNTWQPSVAVTMLSQLIQLAYSLAKPQETLEKYAREGRDALIQLHGEAHPKVKKYTDYLYLMPELRGLFEEAAEKKSEEKSEEAAASPASAVSFAHSAAHRFLRGEQGVVCKEPTLKSGLN